MAEMNGRRRFAHLDRYFDQPAMMEALAEPILNLGLKGSWEPTVIGMTSSRAGEGTTTLALYLGRHIATSFHRPTLIVEANFRRPRMARYCGLPSGPGLDSVLADEEEAFEDSARTVADTPISILPAGKTQINPLSILASGRLERFLSWAKHRFQVVIVDAPPVLSCSESTAILEGVDLRTLVVEANATGKAQVLRSLARLKDRKLPVHGTILNRRRFLFG